MALAKTEMVEILEDLARNGKGTVKIQAIRTLISLGESVPSSETNQFDQLDSDDDLSKRRRKRAAAG